MSLSSYELCTLAIYWGHVSLSLYLSLCLSLSLSLFLSLSVCIHPSIPRMPLLFFSDKQRDLLDFEGIATPLQAHARKHAGRQVSWVLARCPCLSTWAWNEEVEPFDSDAALLVLSSRTSCLFQSCIGSARFCSVTVLHELVRAISRFRLLWRECVSGY